MSRCVGVLRRPLAVVLIPLVALGCYSWQTAKVTPQALVETEHPKTVRVTMADSTRRVLANPRIATDSLRASAGLVWAQNAGGVWVWTDSDSTIAIALRDVTRVEVQRLHTGRTFLLGLVVAGILTFAIVCGAVEGSQCFEFGPEL